MDLGPYGLLVEGALKPMPCGITDLGKGEVIVEFRDSVGEDVNEGARKHRSALPIVA
jgi:hypothetical protein